MRALTGGMAPELAEDLDAQFLGARRVLDDAADHTRHPPVMRLEHRLEVERRVWSGHLHDCVCVRAHITVTTTERGMCRATVEGATWGGKGERFRFRVPGFRVR